MATETNKSTTPLIDRLRSIQSRLQSEPASPFNIEIEVALSDARAMLLDQEKQIAAYDMVAGELVQLDVQHVYHHSDSDGVRVSVKVEKNTKGFNYEASVSGAKSADEALAMLVDTESKLQLCYGAPQG